ncbi:hypothetical protein ACNPNT_03690, partial [Bacillus safensis]
MKKLSLFYFCKKLPTTFSVLHPSKVYKMAFILGGKNNDKPDPQKNCKTQSETTESEGKTCAC